MKNKIIKKFFFNLVLLSIIIALFTNILNTNVKASPGWINITNPASGSIYYEKDTVNIQWTSYDIGNYVKIHLYLNGYFQSTIDSNTSNDGSYLWYIPSNSHSIHSYKIRIISINNPADYDDSGYFYINKKSITVTSPYSSQNIYQGSTYSIRWTSENTGNYFKIDLYKSNLHYQTISSSVYSSSSYGVFYWDVPSDIETTSEYSIKVTDLNDNEIFDFSPYFFIKARSITITSPDGGETLYKGEKYTIHWDSINAGNYIKISYKKEFEYRYTNIISSTYNDGEYQWDIPSYIDIEYNYHIKIESNSYDEIFDISDSFYLDERYININSPTYSTKWLTNESHTIKWESKNAGDNVEIRLLKDNRYYASITDNTKNNGSYEWNFNENINPSSNYKIQIISKKDTNLIGLSQRFTIGIQEIIITTPKKGDIWYAGGSHKIKWSSENIGEYVKIELFKNKKKIQTITHKTENNGLYNWKNIPSDLKAGSNYNIKITSLSDPNITGEIQGKFKIEVTSIQKIINFTPYIIILVIISTILIIIYKYRIYKKENKKNKKPDITKIKQNKINKNITQDEYDEIWEK